MQTFAAVKEIMPKAKILTLASTSTKKKKEKKTKAQRRIDGQKKMKNKEGKKEARKQERKDRKKETKIIYLKHVTHDESLITHQISCT